MPISRWFSFLCLLLFLPSHILLSAAEESIDVEVEVDTEGGDATGEEGTTRQVGSVIYKKTSRDMMLDWLVNAQEEDGHWDSEKHGGGKSMDMVATSLALMAMYSSGNSTKFGKYKKSVRKAIHWIYAQQVQNERGFAHPTFDGSGNDTERYGAALGLLCMLTAYDMNELGKDENPDIHNAIQRAVDAAIKIQETDGGWASEKYGKGKGDTLLSMFWVRGVIYAERLKFKVPPIVIRRAVSFNTRTAKQVTDENGNVYWVGLTHIGGKPTPLATASLLQTRAVLGFKKNDSIVSGCAKALLAESRIFATPNHLPRKNPDSAEYPNPIQLWYLTYLAYWNLGIRNDYRQPLLQELWSAAKKNQTGTGAEQISYMNPIRNKKEAPLPWGRVEQTAFAVLADCIYWHYGPRQPQLY